jgi:hypothetical protein
MSSARRSRAPLDALPAVLAGIAAGLFAVHPLTVEVVAVINYREDLLVTCFLLLALLAVAAARQAATRERALARDGLAAVLATLLACFSKENGILAPILLVLVDVFQAGRHGCRTAARDASPALARPRPHRRQQQRLRCLGAGGRWEIRRWSATRPSSPPSVDRRLSVPLAALTWFLGLGQFLWPAWLSPEYADLPASAGMLALGWGALALLLAGLGVSLWQRRRLGWLGLGLALSIAAYLPHLGLVVPDQRPGRPLLLPARRRLVSGRGGAAVGAAGAAGRAGAWWLQAR